MLVILAMAILLHSQDDPARWGSEALEMLRRDYYLPQTKLYSEKPDKKQPAFNWGVGVMLSALNAASKVNPRYKPWLREYADATRIYWNKGGYDVLPAPKPKDRYYDDNAWMALALLETYQVLGDKKYLDWSKDALEFALRGLAKDGGIYWRESDRASRNTCACAPTAVACFLMFEETKIDRYANLGREIRAWTRKTLRDPKDGLYWDNISNDGRIEETKWSYNTALMIRTEDAIRKIDNLFVTAMDPMTKSAENRWMSDGKSIADPGRFAHLLFEAMLWHEALQEIPGKYRDILSTVRAARNGAGHYPADWKRLAVPENPEILDQAAFARACFVLALELERQ